jgi:hypothetical protein
MTKQTGGIWARYLVVFTLMVGVSLHVTRLVIGPEAFQPLFTPLVDTLFSIPILLAVPAMLWAWSAFDFRGRVDKWIVAFTVAYFTISMPLHVQTWFTQDTTYILRFPAWYSWVFLSYTSALLWVWLRLRMRTA